MAHTGHEKAVYEQKMRQVHSYLEFIELDTTVTSRINKFFEHRFTNKNEASGIVHELPVKLRTEVVLHRFGRTVAVVPFFSGLGEVRLQLLVCAGSLGHCLSDRSPRILQDIVVAICMNFQEFSVLPGDYITHRGDPYRELLIVNKGIARTVPASEDVGALQRDMANELAGSEKDEDTDLGLDAVIDYRDGRYFGELEFLGLSTSRPVSIRAKTFVELASLHPKDIAHIVEDSPPLKARLAKYAGLKVKLREIQERKGHISVVEAELLLQEMEQSLDNGASVADDGGGDKDDDETIQKLMGSDHVRTVPVGEGTGGGDVGNSAKIIRMLDEVIASNAALATGQAELSARLAMLEAKVK